MASGYDLKSSIISRMYCLEGRGAGGLLFIGVYINTYLTKSIRNCYNRLLRTSFGNVLRSLTGHVKVSLGLSLS